MCYSIQMILKARPTKFILYHQGRGTSHLFIGDTQATNMVAI